jgi:hypothetical protein
MQTKATALYPFVPSGPDFRLALAFFAELGFEAAWERDGYAGLRRGGAYFILQRIDVPEWQANQMRPGGPRQAPAGNFVGDMQHSAATAGEGGPPAVTRQTAPRRCAGR